MRKRVKAQGRNATVCAGGRFAQLRQLVSYQATFKGIPIVAVDPRNRPDSCRTLVDPQSQS
jgi:hypothetical protein